MNQVRRRVVKTKIDESNSGGETEFLELVPPPAGEAVNAEHVRERLIKVATQLNATFIGRSDAITAAIVALLTGYNFLFVGPRGTAKTALMSCLFRHVDGARHFAKLLGSFTTISDLIGSLDLAALQAGVERRHVEGKLLDCDLATLDEALKASDGTLNTLLGVLNDTRDFDGQRIPLWTLGSATNWPEVNKRTDRIAALYDRFHIKVPVDAVSTREDRRKVLRTSRTIQSYTPDPGALKAVSALVRQIEIDEVIEDVLCSIQERLLKDSIEVSDRKFGQWQRALQARAWISGRDHVSLSDLDIVPYMAWEDKKQIVQVQAVLSTAGMEITQSLITKIDGARAEYRQSIAALTPAVAERLLEKIATTLEEVNVKRKRYSIEGDNQKAIRASTQKLKQDFDDLLKRFKAAQG
jgi:MoxR-like ATPase